MNRDEIIAMAKEARVSEMGLNIDGSIHLLGLFERFAALVAAKAASRATEACAVLALDKAGTTDYDYSTCINLADAIRARGTKEGV